MKFRQNDHTKIVCFITFIVVTLFFSNQSYAADEEPLGFTVEAILPDTQIDKDQGYFYIKTEPGKVQELKVKVKGTSETPVKVKVYVANASTSEEGTIEYKADTKNDESLSNSTKEITQVETPEFEIKKDEERIVTIRVNTPTQNYEGIKLGTIYFERVDETKVKEGAVNSTYAYRIGLMLSENENSYTDGKSLNLVSVTPELKRLQKTIQLTIQNPEAKIIEDFSMDVSIINEKSGNVVKKQQLKEGRLAPNSHFNFGVAWGIDPIPAGDYIAKVSAKSSFENWNLEKKFTISEEIAKQMNEETVYKLTLPMWSYILLGIIGIVIVIDSVYLTTRYKKWQKTLHSKKSKGRKAKKSKR